MRHQRKTLFVVDVSINWATDRNWQTRLLDTWKVTQMNLPRQESVKMLRFRDRRGTKFIRPESTTGTCSSDGSHFEGLDPKGWPPLGRKFRPSYRTDTWHQQSDTEVSKPFSNTPWNCHGTPLFYLFIYLFIYLFYIFLGQERKYHLCCKELSVFQCLCWD